MEMKVQEKSGKEEESCRKKSDGCGGTGREEVARRMTEVEVHGRRGRGKGKGRWMECVRKDMKKKLLSEEVEYGQAR